MSKKKKQAEQQPEFEAYYYFPSAVYASKKPEFLKAVNEVSEEMLGKLTHDVHELYPMHNTDNFANDPRVQDFVQYIGQNAWGILQSQGYAMDSFNVMVDAMWTQEHHKHSLMEQHVHGGGYQLVGFYFLRHRKDAQEPCSMTREAARCRSTCRKHDMSNATPASNIINFLPEPGMMLISNAWLPHSFGRHGSDKPIKFVHFNLSVQYAPPVCNTSAAEVV
jgi:hypothetical protein